MTGKIDITTNDISHPFINAIITPDTANAQIYRNNDIFYPIAPWKAIVSDENCEESEA